MRNGLRNVTVIGSAMVLAMTLVTAASAQDDAPTTQPDEQMDQRPRRGQRRGGPQMDGERPMRRDGERPMRRGHSDHDMRRPQRGDGDQRFGQGRGGERRFGMSEEDFERVQKVLRDYDPQLAEKVEEVRKRNPREAMQMMRKAAPMVRKLLHAQKYNPEAYELHLQDMKLAAEAHKLGERYRKAGGDDEEAMAQLRAVVARRFDVRQKMRELELAQFEKKLTKLRESIRKRAEARDTLVDKEVAKLTGQNPDPEF